MQVDWRGRWIDESEFGSDDQDPDDAGRMMEDFDDGENEEDEESEEEEELEDIINDFALQEEEMVDTVRPYAYIIYRIRSLHT